MTIFEGPRPFLGRVSPEQSLERMKKIHANCAWRLVGQPNKGRGKNSFVLSAFAEDEDVVDAPGGVARKLRHAVLRRVGVVVGMAIGFLARHCASRADFSELRT